MLNWLLNLATTYPELVAGGVGMLVAITISQVLCWFYFPKDWDNTDQWRAIIPIDVFACLAITHGLWHLLDKGDTAALQWLGSFCFSIGAIAVHLVGLRYAVKRWPWIAGAAVPDAK